MADRPRVVLGRERYSEVKKAHIVPRMYQRTFAVDDQVMVHIVGKDSPVLMSTADAGTRSRYCRRVRPSGERIDDIEASLARVEDKARVPLKELIAGEPLAAERKGRSLRIPITRSSCGP